MKPAPEPVDAGAMMPENKSGETIDRAVTLMYHDVFDADSLTGSGFSGVRGNRWSLQRKEFEQHMRLLARYLDGVPTTVNDLAPAGPELPPVMLSFDDGGVSAYTVIMDVLERYGWKAQFFVPTDFIGKAHFLNAAQIRALRLRGHVIGSHSRSHPSMISRKDSISLRAEWSDSLARLSDILGEKVDSASLPGGDYSRSVGEAASWAGVKALFTSEPMSWVRRVDRCALFGRYAIRGGMAYDREVRLIRGSYLIRSAESLSWTIKKLAKAVGGETYLRLRTAGLEYRYSAPTV